MCTMAYTGLFNLVMTYTFLVLHPIHDEIRAVDS